MKRLLRYRWRLIKTPIDQEMFMGSRIQRWIEKTFGSQEKPFLLTSEQMEHWQSRGFLVLKDFFKPEEIRTYEEEVSRLLAERCEKAGDVVIDVLGGAYAGRRMRLRDAPDEAIEHPHKINDLFLVSDNCRSLNLHPRLAEILASLLQAEPLVINSLTFTKGSQQPYHFDTYYMPPPVEGHMVVSSICLEDQTEAVGPLCYYPGSHLIPPYRFSHGGLWAVNEEMPQAQAYIREQLEQRGLQSETFIGNKGDVFIWHGQLYHGGSVIKDHNKTRCTLVTHYWACPDVEEDRQVRLPAGGAYLQRDHQPVPTEKK
jgi:phytanoyl-CoA hydroxylase